MKNLKSLFSIILIAFALITVTSCGDESEDPKPSEIEQIKAELSGLWEFSTVSVKQLSSNKVEEVKSCDVTNVIKNFGSTFNGWKPDFDYQYSGSETATIISNCGLGSAPLTWTVVENSNGFLITIGSREWLLKSLNDITSTQVTLTDLSSFNTSQYDVTYKFSK